MNEKTAWSISGYPMIAVTIVWVAATFYSFVMGIVSDAGPAVIVPSIVICVAGGFFFAAGFVMVQPKESRVLVLFGAYHGTLNQEGTSLDHTAMPPTFAGITPPAQFRKRQIQSERRKRQSDRNRINCCLARNGYGRGDF